MRGTVIMALLLSFVRSYGQPAIGSWVTYTGMNAVTSVSLRDNLLAAATTGGLFVYDTASLQFSRYNNSQGISSNDLLSVLMAPNGSVWTGASDGGLTTFPSLAALPQRILSIQEKGTSRPGIRQFAAAGDSLLIAWESGVSVFISSKGEFGDTYGNFGFVGQPIISSVVVRTSRIWVGTNKGIATASLSSANLLDPASWSIISSLETVCLEHCGDSLYAGTPGGLYTGSGTGSLSPVPGFSGSAITGLAVEGRDLYVLSSAYRSFRLDLWRTANQTRVTVTSGTDDYASSLAVKNGVYAIGTSDGGVLLGSSASWKRLLPPGPASNRFLGLAVDANGVLWAAGGPANGKGFYSLDLGKPQESQWNIFSVKRFPVMKNDNYFRVSVGSNGRIWAGSWGGGIVEVVADTVRRRLDATTIPSVATTRTEGGDPNFPVVGLVAEDVDGSSWIPVSNPADGNVILRLTGDTTSRYIRCAFSSTSLFFQGILIDRNRTKWIINAEPTYTHLENLGLLYYNEILTLPGTSGTNGWGLMTVSDGLPNQNVMAVAEDLEGNIWVGTGEGAIIVSDPTRPQTRSTSVFTLRGRFVQSIAVDGVNNKWVGTKDGIFVFNSDATQLIHEFTVATTGGKLVDNDVRSIVIDQTRGIVYAGTEKGLSALRIAAINPSAEYTEILVAPNPFLLPSAGPVEIRNLVANSTIKIVSTAGHVVVQFKAQGGGRALWDGKDDRGRWVGSGVYFVVAFADNGKQVATGKVAVVRR